MSELEQKFIDLLPSSLLESLGEEHLREHFRREATEFVTSLAAKVDEDNPPPIPEAKFEPWGENVVDFLKREWGEWMDRGLLTKAILRKADKKAVSALNNQMSYLGGMPEGLNIITHKDANDRFYERSYFHRSESTRVRTLVSRKPT